MNDFDDWMNSVQIDARWKQNFNRDLMRLAFTGGRETDIKLLTTLLDQSEDSDWRSRNLLRQCIELLTGRGV